MEKFKLFFKKTDKSLLLFALILSLVGLVLIYSATLSKASNKFMLIQGATILLGVFIYILLTFIDISNLSHLWKYIFVLNCIFLASVFFFGVGGEETGNNSWLRFFGIGIQPAEVGKLLFILTLCRHVADMDCQVNKFKNLLQLLIHCAIPMGIIIVTSGDVGVSLPYLFILLIVLIAAGLKLRWLAIIGALGGVMAPILWFFGFSANQRDRILVVLDPSLDPLGKGYHAIQSKIAIGSGQLFGRGFMLGSQTQNSFLPAKWTDFIFSVAGEEFGMIGVMLLLILSAAIILRCFLHSAKITNSFFSLVCTAVGAMFAFQVIINIGMCIGLTPVIGITLPFVSYGGSSMLTSFACLGLVSSAKFHRSPSSL